MMDEATERGRKRLQQVIDAYGADPARWPVSERSALEPLLERGSTALREAEALDRLLALASSVEPRGVPAFGLLSRPRPAITRPGALRHIGRWTAMLPLAASVAMGIYLGSGNTLDGILPDSLAGDGAVSVFDVGAADLTGLGEAELFTEEDRS